MSDPIASGNYARKQIYCPSAVVAWSHGSRFRLAARLAGAARGGRLLDYGCGDGTFIAQTHGTFARAVGSDIDQSQLDGCRRRFANLAAVEFIPASDLAGLAHRHAHDVVTCMEVLEHCTDSERVRILDVLPSLLAPRGFAVISVPIEIGPALVGKQLFRAIAAARGHGDYQYRETYSPRELAAAALGRPNLARARYTVDGPDGPVEYCGHKGFDWRLLERELHARYTVEQRLFTPMPFLGRVMNSQVWFVCRPRSARRSSE